MDWIALIVAFLAFWARLEHRLTRLETKIEELDRQSALDRRSAAEAERRPARSGAQGLVS